MDEDVACSPNLCRRCNRNALFEYEYEFTCLVCEFIVVKTKNQLTKTQREKIADFEGRLTYATPKIIAICLEISSMVQTNKIDVLAAVVTYLEQKKVNVIGEILKKVKKCFYKRS